MIEIQHSTHFTFVHAIGTPDETLKMLQEIVDGFIELITIPGHIALQMIVNEDAKERKLPMNKVGTVIAGQPVFGTVVLVERFRMSADGEPEQWAWR